MIGKRAYGHILRKNLYFSGKPLYLSFHEAVLESIFIAANPESVVKNDAISRLYNKECNHNLKYSWNSVSLDPVVWEEDNRGLSLAICYAVQQILAVEDMNARSFYEPYIEHLSATNVIQSNHLHENPLGTDFDLIWGTVQSELIKHLGCKQTQITFSKGRGKNKLRNFPFTQSLLSGKELSKLARKLPQDKDISKICCRKLVLRNESCLTNRSKKKLTNNEFVESISEQLSSYINHNKNQTFYDELKESAEASKYKLEILYISGGFEPDTYELVTRDMKSNILSVNSFKEIESYFNNGFVLFLSKNAGQWISSNISKESVSDIKSIIIGVQKVNAPSLVLSISSKLDVDPIAIDLYKYFEGDKNTEFYEFPLYDTKNIGITIEQLFSDVARGQKHALLEMDGGLIVDKRKYRYLVNYPPVSIKYAGKDLPSNEKLLVNEEELTVKELFDKIFNVYEECIFHITYREINKTIGFEKSKFDLILDNPVYKIFNEKLHLSAVCESTPKHVPFFSHFNIFNYKSKGIVVLSPNDLLIYSHIPFSCWVPLPENDLLLSVITNSLQTSEATLWVQIFISEIKHSMRIPYPLLLKFAKYWAYW